jgi:hypothetical protein
MMPGRGSAARSLGQRPIAMTVAEAGRRARPSWSPPPLAGSLAQAGSSLTRNCRDDGGWLARITLTQSNSDRLLESQQMRIKTWCLYFLTRYVGAPGTRANHAFYGGAQTVPGIPFPNIHSDEQRLTVVTHLPMFLDRNTSETVLSVTVTHAGRSGLQLHSVGI